MISILLDSSNTSLMVALALDDQIIESISYEAWQRQSEVMIPELNKLLDKYGYSKDDIKDVLVAIGPGSYTGVRIAITIAKTIATCLDCPIYAFSSLQILKKGDVPSICLINARSNRSYIGVYQGSKCLLSDQIMVNDDVLIYLKNHPDYAICGETSYLGLNGYKSDLAIEMLSLKKSTKPCQNSLGLQPIYLKD